MRYLLDTNACSAYLNRRPSPIKSRIAVARPGDIVLCDVVKAELLYGAYKSLQVAANLALLERFFRVFVSYPFDGRAADVYGRERARLEAAGTPIGPYDLLIAAIALANDLIVVTHNTREFSRVAGLSFEDWQV